METARTEPSNIQESIPPLSEVVIKAEIPLEISTGNESVRESQTDSISQSDLNPELTNAPVEPIVNDHVKVSAREDPSRQNITAPGSTGRARALSHGHTKREERLIRILEHVRTNTNVRNDEIAKLLHVSDRTATRYANILVVRGKLFRSGKGRSVTYTPTSS